MFTRLSNILFNKAAKVRHFFTAETLFYYIQSSEIQENIVNI